MLDEFELLVAAASRAAGRPLCDPVLICERMRNRVLRCHGADGKPVIVKQAHRENPLLHNDRAAVEFLDARGRFAPRFLGGDVGARLFVMSYLNALAPLDRICAGQDREAAVEALEAVAACTAEMHLAARGRRDDYDRLRGTLAGAEDPCRREADRFRQLHDRVLSVLRRYGCLPAPGFEAEMNGVAERLAEPGDYLTLTNGDMAPSNAGLCAGGPVLFDFEYAGYRHAFTDHLLWLIICPFPDDVADRAEAAYRGRIGADVPAALEDEAYGRELTAIAAHHLFWSITWRLEEVHEEDAPWVGNMSTRLAYLHKARSFVRLAARTGAWPAMLQTAAELLDRMRARFDDVDEGTPLWRAFA